MKRTLPNNLNTFLILIVSGAFLFLPGLGLVHLFDWDEINFAEMARELIVTKQYSQMLMDFQPFYEKPPLFIWMQVLSMKMFGINEYAARLPNAICGISVAVILYQVGSKIQNRSVGLWWAGLYIASFLPHFYFKSGIIDPWFNTFIFLSIYFFFAGHQWSRSNWSAVWSGIFGGCAILTKGPVALLILGLLVLVVWVKSFSDRRFALNINKLFLSSGFILLTAGSWFVIEYVTNGSEFIEEFIRYQMRLLRTQDAGHGGPFFYHILVLLIGCFPMSCWALGFFQKNKSDQVWLEASFRFWMLALFWIILIVFSIVQTKIVHYSSLCYFPLGYFAAVYLTQYTISVHRLNPWVKFSLLIVGIPWVLMLLILPVIGNHLNWIVPYIKDPFAVANIQADVTWPYYLVVLAILVLLSLVLALKSNKKISSRPQAILLHLLLLLITIQGMIYLVVPRIELYTQGAAVEFFEGLENQPVEIEVIGYKSYAQYFYACKPAHVDKRNPYAISKIDNKRLEELKQEYSYWYEKNGFIFFKPRAN